MSNAYCKNFTKRIKIMRSNAKYPFVDGYSSFPNSCDTDWVPTIENYQFIKGLIIIKNKFGRILEILTNSTRFLVTSKCIGYFNEPIIIWSNNIYTTTYFGSSLDSVILGPNASPFDLKTADYQTDNDYNYSKNYIGMVSDIDNEYQLSSIYSYALYETPNSLHNGTCDLLDGLEIRVDLRDLAYQYTKTDIISAYLPVQYDNNLFGASHLTSVNGCLEE